jgi:glycosyltransferase involved in cell wall biosynthesis
MGNVENSKILDFYSENYVDLFINFSEFEGVPVSIMEAQSASITVLATKVGGTTEIVSSENGFLVEKYFDLSETVKQINSFLNSSNESIVKKRKSAYLSWKKSYRAEKNYIDFFKSLRNIF